VRDFTITAVAAGGSGAGSVSMPQGLNKQDEEIIAFLQNNSNGQIVAAVSSPIP